MKTSVMDYLKTAGIEYKIKRHSRDVYTCEDAARERGVKIEQIVKTMIVKKPDGELIAVLIPGNKRLNTKIITNEWNLIENYPIWRIKSAISIADRAASHPLLPAFVPALSMACSMVSEVIIPNKTGTPLLKAV